MTNTPAHLLRCSAAVCSKPGQPCTAAHAHAHAHTARARGTASHPATPRPYPPPRAPPSPAAPQTAAAPAALQTRGTRPAPAASRRRGSSTTRGRPPYCSAAAGRRGRPAGARKGRGERRGSGGRSGEPARRQGSGGAAVAGRASPHLCGPPALPAPRSRKGHGPLARPAGLNPRQAKAELAGQAGGWPHLGDAPRVVEHKALLLKEGVERCQPALVLL